jgi:hypothetical protein
MTSTVNTYLARIQTDPQGDNPQATAFFGQDTIVDGVTYSAPWTSVVWPLVSDKTVTVDGLTLTYTQVSAFVTAIANQEKNTPPAPTPEPTPAE